MIKFEPGAPLPPRPHAKVGTFCWWSMENFKRHNSGPVRHLKIGKSVANPRAIT